MGDEEILSSKPILALAETHTLLPPDIRVQHNPERIHRYSFNLPPSHQSEQAKDSDTKEKETNWGESASVPDGFASLVPASSFPNLHTASRVKKEAWAVREIYFNTSRRKVYFASGVRGQLPTTSAALLRERSFQHMSMSTSLSLGSFIAVCVSGASPPRGHTADKQGLLS